MMCVVCTHKHTYRYVLQYMGSTLRTKLTILIHLGSLSSASRSQSRQITEVIPFMGNAKFHGDSEIPHATAARVDVGCLVMRLRRGKMLELG